MSVLDIGASKMCVQGRAYENGVEIVGAANCASYGFFSDGVLFKSGWCEDSIFACCRNTRHEVLQKM